MITVAGKYNSAIIYAEQVEENVISQLTELCSQKTYKDSKIRIMADCHCGKGSVIGCSMTIGRQITPNLVGVDINCGMYTVKLKESEIDFQRLDNVIRRRVPAGSRRRHYEHRFFKNVPLENLNCFQAMSKNEQKGARFCLGTLGGGNHFIEIDKDENDNFYLVIHSGSRSIGLAVAEYYQNLAISYREAEVPEELAPLNEDDTRKYLRDVEIITQYANQNRYAIADEIVNGMGWKIESDFTTCHNYIDMENMILRKGAISAQKDELVLIPLNMRDGSLLCRGKGNPEWNFTAPHGAGRLYSRGKAFRVFTLDDYKNNMRGVWSSSVCRATLDEAPMAYKPAEEIIAAIGDTVEIIARLIPVYNFKAQGRR